MLLRIQNTPRPQSNILKPHCIVFRFPLTIASYATDAAAPQKKSCLCELQPYPWPKRNMNGFLSESNPKCDRHGNKRVMYALFYSLFVLHTPKKHVTLNIPTLRNRAVHSCVACVQLKVSLEKFQERGEAASRSGIQSPHTSSMGEQMRNSV